VSRAIHDRVSAGRLDVALRRAGPDETHTGNRRARVRITYEGKNSGNVIATSVAEFEVAPFSNFDFANNVANSQGQPSSGAFVPPVSCAAIDDISRRDLDVEAS
jgi:hypothetical protein